MTYSISASLQQAIYTKLSLNTELASLLGSAVFDGVPPGAVPPLYVTIGEERASDRSDYDERGAVHEIDIAVISSGAGFSEVKAVAAAVSDALLAGPLVLARGRCDGLWFRQARARRVRRGGSRRIDLRFRARVFDDL